MLGAPPFLVNIFPSVMLAGSRSSQNVSEKEILQRLLLATAEGFHNLAAVPVCFVRNVSFAIPQDQPHNQVQCTSKCTLNTHTFYRIPLRPVAGSTLFSTFSYTFHWHDPTAISLFRFNFGGGRMEVLRHFRLLWTEKR